VPPLAHPGSVPEILADCHVRFVTRLNAAFEGRHGIGRYGIEIPHNVDGT